MNAVPNPSPDETAALSHLVDAPWNDASLDRLSADLARRPPDGYAERVRIATPDELISSLFRANGALEASLDAERTARKEATSLARELDAEKRGMAQEIKRNASELWITRLLAVLLVALVVVVARCGGGN